MNLALFLLVTLGPPIIPSTPALQPATPYNAAAAATADGYVVAYGSPSGISIVHVDEAGTPSPEHAEVLPGGFAFVGDAAGELISYSDGNGAGVMRLDGTRMQLTSTAYAIARLAWNGHEYLFAWNDRGTIDGLLLDANATAIGQRFTIATFIAWFSIASSGDSFLAAAFLGNDSVFAIPISPSGTVGAQTSAGSGPFQLHDLVGTENGYLLGLKNAIIALDRDGRPRSATQPIPADETLLAITAGAFALTDHGTLLALDADAHVTATSKVAPQVNATLATSQHGVLVVGYDGTSVVDRATLRATPPRPIATVPLPQSAPLIVTADDGTILAAWEAPFQQRRLGRIRGNTPIDGDGIALEGSGAAIGSNGRDFLIATGGATLSIASLGTSGPMSAPRIIDTATDQPNSIIWNGSNYIVFFTRWTATGGTTCGSWREQIYAATISSDLRNATIQLVDLGPGSQKNALAVKTRDGIALAYSPAHAIEEAGGFTVRCRDTTDVALATLDNALHLTLATLLSARGPRDDETPVDITTDGTRTIVTWSLVLDPHNNGARSIHNTLNLPIAGAVWTGSSLALIEPAMLPPGVDTIVTSRGALAYITSSIGFGLGDSQVMVVRRVEETQPPRVRPSR